MEGDDAILLGWAILGRLLTGTFGPRKLMMQDEEHGVQDDIFDKSRRKKSYAVLRG